MKTYRGSLPFWFAGRVFLLCALLATLSRLQAAIAGPLTTRMPLKPPGTDLDLTSNPGDSYGLPTALLDKLVSKKKIFQARTLLARTPRRPGDEDVRLAWEAACLAAEERYEQAAVEFDKVKHMDRAPICVLHWAARSYGQTDNYARAIECAGYGIKRCNDYHCYEVRAGCYSVEKRYYEASSDYQKAAVFCPRRACDFFALAAHSMMAAKKPLEALRLVDKAPLGMGAELDANTLMTRALCLEQLKRWSEAVTALTRAVALSTSAPSNGDGPANVYLNHCLEARARCYDQLGNKAAAAADRLSLEKLSRGLESDLVGKQH